MKRSKAFLAAFFILIISCSRAPTNEEIDKQFAPIKSKYGIEIIYKIDDHFLSASENPYVPSGPAPTSKVEPMENQVLARYPGLLQQALSRYPVQLLKRDLKAVHLAKEIDQDGLKYAGSYDPFRKIVFLVNDGKQDELFAVATFHHEFSSILLNQQTFHLNPWEEQNPEGFQYLYERYGNYRGLMDNNIKVSTEGTAEDYEKGFLNSFSQTNFENDFNEYSAMIFTYPQEFKTLMDKYPRITGKFRVWLKFYQQIDPIFTEAYLFGEGARN